MNFLLCAESKNSVFFALGAPFARAKIYRKIVANPFLHVTLKTRIRNLITMMHTRPLLTHSIESLFCRLGDLLHRISDKNYSRPLHLLSGASVGKQVRHCIEVAEALLNGRDVGLISYDRRDRNPLYESSTKEASAKLLNIAEEIREMDWNGSVRVSHVTDPKTGEENILESSWERELLYVQEHTIHHEAIIRVALEHDLGFDDIPENFGFAISTIQYNLSRSFSVGWDPVI